MTSAAVRAQLFSENGGEVFNLITEVADSLIYNSKYVRTDEKLFFHESLKKKEVDYCGNEKFIICMLEAIHHEKEANDDCTKKSLAQKRRRLLGEHARPFVTFLRDVEGSLVNSWCFLKFVMPLYQDNFDLLLVDLPGYGKSSIGNNFSCELKRWRDSAAKMLSYILSEAKVTKSHFICAGGSAAMFFELLKGSTGMMQQRHILINPVFSQEDLADVVTPQKLGEILRNTIAHVHVFYDPRTYGDKGQLRPKWKMMETIQLLQELAADEAIANHMTIVEISNYDLATVLLAPSPAPGTKEVHGLLPSAYFLAFVRRYILGAKLPPFHLGFLEAVNDMESEERKQREGGDKLERQTSKLSRALSMRSSSIISQQSADSEGNAETAKQRRTRLSKWSQKPADPDLSYGVRVRDQDELQAIAEVKKQSAVEYEELYGQTDREVRYAIKASEATFQEESMDERLIELRQRAPLDEREQIRQWQLAAEESLKLEMLHEMTEEELLRKGIEESLNFYVAEENDIDKAIKESQETHNLETLARQE